MTCWLFSSQHVCAVCLVAVRAHFIAHFQLGIHSDCRSVSSAARALQAGFQPVLTHKVILPQVQNFLLFFVELELA